MKKQKMKTTAVLCLIIAFFALYILSTTAWAENIAEKSEVNISKEIVQIENNIKHLEISLNRYQETLDYIKEVVEIARKYNTTPEIILTIEREVRKYEGLNTNIIYRVIQKESNFNPNAINYNPHNGSYDIGIMQINNGKTGQWLAETHGISNVTNEMLFNIEFNIKMGVWYLNYLHEKYDRDWHKTLTAYNMGPTGMKKHFKKHNTTTSKYSREILDGII